MGRWEKHIIGERRGEMSGKAEMEKARLNSVSQGRWTQEKERKTGNLHLFELTVTLSKMIIIKKHKRLGEKQWQKSGGGGLRGSSLWFCGNLHQKQTSLTWNNKLNWFPSLTRSQ